MVDESLMVDKSLREDLKNMPSSEFISKWVIDAIPFVCVKNYALHAEWRHDIARQLKIDPNDIIMSGSASLGVSLSPHKLLREFNEKSDIDIGVISEHYFDIAWHELRRINMNEPKLTQAMSASIKEHRSRYIYWGTIATDRILPLLSFGSEWDKIMNSLQRYPCFENRTINFRIYKDNKSFRDYLIQGIAKCRDRLLEETI